KRKYKKKKEKMKGVEKNQNEKENLNNNILSKKRHQAINIETELTTDVEQYQEADMNYFAKIRTEVEKEKVNENVPLEPTE
ncbi:13651_t:CDS:2, partial [Cetraspora pellucida]